MTNYINFLDTILIPAIFENADRVFDWLNLKKSIIGDWETPNRLFGGVSDKRRDKTVLRTDFKYLLIENDESGAQIQTVVYYQEYKRLATYHHAVREIAEILGLKVPNSFESKELTEEQQAQQKKDWTIKNINSEVMQYATKALRDGLTANSGIAYAVINYLRDRRKWSNDYLNYCLENMLIGIVIPQLREYLSADFEGSIVKEVCDKLDKQTYSDYRLLLPIWTYGTVTSFKTRTIGDDNPKYRNDSGERAVYDLSVSKDKSVYLVEGELDAIALSYLGYNAIALSGTNSGKAIDYAVSKGYQTFTYIPDYEGLPSKVLNSGLTRADKALTTFQSIVNALQKHGVSNIYVAPINPPTDKENKWDADKLLHYDDGEALKATINNTVAYYQYFAGMKFERYKNEKINLNAKVIDELQNSFITYRLTNENTQILSEYYKAYSNVFEAMKKTPLTEAEFKAYRKEYADRWKNKEIIEGLRKEIDVTLRELNSGLQNGRNEADIIAATKQLGNKLTQAKTAEKVSEHKRVAYWTEAEVADDLNKISEGGIDSGITIGYDKLIFPNAAISTIAGATGAGKTAFLVQSMINAIKSDTNKKLLYISLEERATAIIARFINGLYDDGKYYENGNINFLDTNRIIKTTTNYKVKNKAVIYSRLRAKADSFIYKDVSGEQLINDSQLNSAVREFFALQKANRLRVAAVDYDYLELLDLITSVSNEVGGLDGVFIDYMQLIKIRPSKETRANSRQEELKHICIALNEYAKTTNIPIILGSQFNREVKNIESIHETNLGEAGDIERISNVIVALYKTNAEMKNLPVNKDFKNKDELFRDNQIYAKILKNRDGENNLTELLAFNGNTGRICNYVRRSNTVLA